MELVQSWGGVFEVSLDGELIWSKKRSGRFPDWADIRAHLTPQGDGG